MAVPLDVLQALASTFSSVLDGPSTVSPGSLVRVRLTPSAADGLTATDLVDGSFNLTWITKNVRFDNATTESVFDADPFVPSNVNALLTADGTPPGGMPAIVPAIVPLPGLNSVGTQALTGVPGELSQLAGTFPIAVEVPVSVTVAWSVIGPFGPLSEGSSTFTAPNGLASPEVSFLFVPQTVELTNTITVPMVRLLIRATITLTAGTTTHSQVLPDIPIDIPAIPIPKVIVFFLHTNFAAADGDDDGAAFIVVPNNSPLRSLAELQTVLNTLESTLSSLTSIAELAAFLLGVSDLTGALAAQPHVQFRVANSSNHINNFNDITLIQRGWFSNDTEAEDELSSLIFIGPNEEKGGVRCFIHRNRGGGRFTLTIGPELHAIVRSLHSSSPAVEPAGAAITIDNPADTFGDELSSLAFL